MKELESRVKRLEDEMGEACKDLKTIMTNHLPHINAKIAVLMAQMVVVLAALAYLIFG